ncbi:MAG: hypothetical protein R3257_04190 [bacterium]|nr:hypothetical protein [bacterium]
MESPDQTLFALNFLWNGTSKQRDQENQVHCKLQHLVRCANAGNHVGFLQRLPEIRRLAAKTLSKDAQGQLYKKIDELRFKLLRRSRALSLRSSRRYFDQASEAFKKGEKERSEQLFHQAREMGRYAANLGQSLAAKLH